MCRHQPGRRCPHTGEKQKLANTNRRLARAKRRNVAELVGENLGDGARAAVMDSNPSDLALLTLRVNRHDPELADAIRREVQGEFPGTHNMVLQDTRTSALAVDHENEDPDAPMKPNPQAATRAGIQRAMLDIDQAVLDRGDMLLPEYEDLQQSVAVRQKALDMGLTPGTPVNSKTDLDPEAAHWLGSLSPEAVPYLTETQEDVGQEMFDAAFRNADLTVSQRASSLNKEDSRKTFADLYAEAADADPDRDPSDRVKVEIGEGVVLTADHEGRPVLKVDDRLTLPVMAESTPEKVLPKVLRVDDITTDPKTDAPMGQASIYERITSPDTPQGKATRRALSDSAIEAAFFADRPVGRKEIADGLTGVRANVGRAGKSPRVGGAELAGYGQRHGDAEHRREEGFLLNGNLARGNAEAHNSVNAVLTKNGRPSLDKTQGGKDRPKVTRTYQGGLDKDALNATRRSGFNPRTGSTMSEADLPKVEAPAAEGTLADGGSPLQRLYRDPKRKAPSDADIDRAVAQANGPKRRGRNPETVGQEALVQGALLDRAVLVRDSRRRLRGAADTHTGAVVQAIPAGVSLSEVFPTGGAVDTKGYVAIGSGEDIPVGPKDDGARQVKVVYKTGKAAHVSPNRAVIGDGSRFRVQRVDPSGDMPTVYMIEEDLALDTAPSETA